MSVKILVEGIRLLARHGVTVEERSRVQPFEIDLVLELAGDRAATTDDLSDTVDYGEAVGLAVEGVEGTEHQLVESLARSIQVRLMERFAGRLESARVTVRKLKPPVPFHVRSVGVTVE